MRFILQKCRPSRTRIAASVTAELPVCQNAMVTWSQIRVFIGSFFIVIAISAVVGFGNWQQALAGLSPDGQVTEYSWVALRIMLAALFVPGVALVAPTPIIALLVRGHAALARLPISTFLTYTLGAAVMLRIVVILIMPLRLVSDFAFYDRLAMLWVSHGEYTDGSHPTSYFPPGWPFFLSRLYLVFGHHPQIGIVANVAFGTGVVNFTWRLVRRIWGESRARWAALIVAVMPNELLFTNVLGSEGLFTLLLLGSLILLMPGRERGLELGARALVGGIFLGMATLTRSLAFMLPIVLLGVYLIYDGASRRTAIRWVVCVAGLLIVTVPWIMRNEARLGRATISTNAGMNFYIGNNPTAGVGYNNPPQQISPQTTAADEAREDSLGFALGKQYTLAHPFAFLVRGALKSVYFLTSDMDVVALDVGEAANRAVFDRYCWLALAVQSVWWAFLIGVALGVLYFLRSSPSHDAGGLLLLGIILYWVAVHFVFFGTGRFHMPIVPAMAAFAGLAMTRFGEHN